MIVVVEVFLEVWSLVYIDFFGNEEFVKFVNVEMEEVKEEVCVLYVFLMVVVRVLKSIICIDIEVFLDNVGEIVKVMVK